MRTLLALAAAAVLGFASTTSQTVWTVDKAHSHVDFSVAHLVIAEVTGRFTDFTVTLNQAQDDFTGSELSAVIKTASINTDNEGRDKHIRSDEFLNADKYPEITFQSTSFEKTGGNTYRINGNLTIRDVMKPVVLEAVYKGTVTDTRGNVKSAFKATTTIDRFEYGVKWNKATETGGLVAGKDISITLNMELAKQK